MIKATGHVPALVEGSAQLIGDNKNLAALMMLFIGLFITMGIGSSFSTVPILATIYVPLCISFGFSPMATVAIIGAAGALGDAVVPTFIHFNLPLILTTWLATMVL